MTDKRKARWEALREGLRAIVPVFEEYTESLKKLYTHTYRLKKLIEAL